ncbi:MAG: metalloregulator ArsR/SmtB family transcription factor [Deltaproteobacteria bacterium]|nr:metalloregulator ArsR/SmtB family transcription factor [Deltaproteobacteria bacterium]
MRAEARFFKSLADETRLKILWLLLAEEELCVCDVVGALGITQSKASRHLRYLFNLGWVNDRREGLLMNYRLCVPPGSPGEKQLQLLTEMFAPHPEAQALRARLHDWLGKKRQAKVKEAAVNSDGSSVKLAL